MLRTRVSRDRSRPLVFPTIVVLTLALLGLTWSAPPAGAEALGNAYVVNNDSADISQYAMAAGGELSPLNPATVAAGPGPGAVAVSPDGKSVYVTNSTNNTVSQYDVDQMSGALSPKVPPAVATGTSPRDVAVTPDGTSAYVTNGGSGNTVSQYDIHPETGALSPKTPASVATGALSAHIAVTPDGTSAYVVTGTSTGSGGLFQYDIDPQTGALSPKTPASVTTRFCQRVCLSSIPHDITVTPDGYSVHVTDLSSNTIVQFNIDPWTGALTPKFPPPVETGGPPEYVPAGTTPLAITVTQYDIDPASGALSPKTPATVAAGSAPTDVAVSADGTSAYVTNGSGNNVSQYDIDASTGALSPKTTATAGSGASPSGIAVPWGKHLTAVTLSCAPSAVVAGQVTTCTVVVNDIEGDGATTPSGTVRFHTDSSGVLGSGGSCVLSGSGASASCQLDYTPSTVGSGTHALLARYRGDATHVAGPARTSVSVAARATTMTVSCAPDPVVVGHSTSCTATVSDTEPAGTPSTPTGDSAVSFASDSSGSFTNGNTCNLSGSGGTASCSQNYDPSSIGSGSVTMTASFLGDPAHAATSATTTVSVVGRQTSTDLSCSPASMAVGRSTTCTATVGDGQLGGTPTAPSGTVSVSGDSSGTFSGGAACTLAGSTNPTSCQITYTPTNLGSGTHTLTGTYNGDSTHATSAGRADLVVGSRFNAHPSSSPAHAVNLSKAVSLTESRPASPACSVNYGPACATPSTVTVSAPAFAGPPNAEVTAALCNGQVATAPNSNGSGGLGDVSHGCDFGNARGYGAVGVPNSGALHLNASGNCCVEATSVTLQLPSTNKLTQFGGPTGTNTNAAAVCPPTPTQIAAGWTCQVGLSLFETAQPFAASAHTGYRQAFLKSPIPSSITCNGGACPASIATGTAVTITGVQFPCRTIVPDDPTTAGYDGACVQPHAAKTILIKRVSTGLLVPGPITPTSQTANVNGNYSVSFTMPAVPAPGELYKIVPHAPSCSFPCESGNFNAAGKLIRHA